jgi:HEAT repeat protein
MTTTVKIRMAATAGILLFLCFAGMAAVVGDEGGVSPEDRVEQVFAKGDELAAWKEEQSRLYLSTLADEQLAELYAPVPVQFGIPLEAALRAVKEDRQKIIDELVKHRCPLNEQDEEAFRFEHEKLADQLAALGAEAVPAIAQQMDRTFRTTGRLPLARQAILKVGKDAVEPLIGLIDSDDRWLRRNVANLLSEFGDPRSRDTLLRALRDDEGGVRRYALEGLVKMGPDVVGLGTLRAVLLKQLEDDYDRVRHLAIEGLELYGDETAIGPLSVVERFDLSPTKVGTYFLRYSAREAINAILRRAGKPVKEVSREDYDRGPPSYEQLCEAADCPNAGIRCDAVRRLGYRKDEEGARFLLEQLGVEQEVRVLTEICDALASVMTPPRKSSTPVVPAELMQEGFDSFIHLAQTHGSAKVRVAAIRGVSRVLYAADQSKVPLHGIERFKELVREGLSSKDETLRIPCYSAVTTIARVSPETALSWSALERGQLQEQLIRWINAPHIRLIECLGHIGYENISPRLIELLQHDDASIRRFAAYALGRIGDPRAIPALRRTARADPAQYEDGTYGVRRAAAQALEKILENKDDPARHERIGLQLVIRSDKEVYAAGDPIRLSGYLVNVGDRPVTVYAPQASLLPPAPIEVVRWSIKGAETVSRPKGELLRLTINVPAKVVHEEPWISRNTFPKPGLDDFTSLSPGEEVQLSSANVADERFRLTWGDKPNLHDLRSPGEYVLQARYSNSLKGDEFGLNAWMGGLRSDELTIVVK